MKKVFGNWWFLTGLIVLLLVLVLCVGLPFFVGGLKPWWVRLTIGALIVGIWLLAAFLRRRKARKAAEAIERELAGPSAEDDEGKLVAQRLNEALTALKKQSGSKRDYLYRQPWYVIIGPPGSGKTTALLNSGLRFPFADQSVRGVGGTRNLDFWFAEEAVLVDTAGRYTTQDSDSSVDSRGWTSFLKLMAKQRPLSPINGVIVAIGVDELLGTDRAGLDRHAALVRRRLAELRQTLEFAVPVYFIITKADLISGFVEYYDDLDVEGRRAVLGTTLPEGRPKIDDVVGAFDRLVASQGERQARRLYEEVDQTRRSLVLGYPAQLGALRNRFARFVEGAFLGSDKQPEGLLRGFYFTSGVQEGAPLDRILAGVAEVYQGGGAATLGGSGRTYFLNRLLTQVVFPEAGMAQADPTARKRQKMQLTMGYGGVAAAVALVLIAWGVSFAKNYGFLGALDDASAHAATLTRETGLDLVEVRATDPDIEQSLVVLRALRNLPQGYAEQQAGEPGWLRRFGLYQSSHAQQAVEAYRDGLRRILLPRLLLRLEQFIATNTGTPMEIYQPLKAYLMLGGQGPMDSGTVKSWIETDWAREQFPGADNAPIRREMASHLSALLEDEGLTSAWPGRKTPLDGATIASARGALQTLSLADRAYAVMKLKAMSGKDAPWRADAALAAGDAQAFTNGPEVLQLQVPFFFTRLGYEKLYQAGLATVAADIKKDMWVLGSDAETSGIQSQMSQIRPGVAALYARDYIAAWEEVLNKPLPADYFNDTAARGAFTKSPSPLKVLLLEIAKNTTFKGGSSAAKDAVGQAIASSRLGRATTVAGNVSIGGAFDAAREIENHFAPINQYVGDGKTPGPLDEFINAVKLAGANVESAKLTGGMGGESVQSAMQMSMGGVVSAAGGAPAQLQGFISGVASGGTQATVTAATGALSEAYNNSVKPSCMLATQDKYPFFGTSGTDASPVEIQSVFGMGGSFDGFVKQRVLPMLDMGGPIWRWNASNPTAAALDPAAPDQFHKATELRDLLVSGINVSFDPRSFGPGIDAADLVVGSATYRFEKGAGSDPKQVAWSATGFVPQASVTLLRQGQAVDKITASGPWALFRLMDKARMSNAGPQTITAEFGRGSSSIVFKVGLPGASNPFSRGGVWGFRCPSSL